MSERFRIPAIPSADRSPRGQSLTEFALILPMLLVLLLGIADFGRVFAAGITLEAAARNAAEAAAQEYVQRNRNSPGTTLSADDYAAVHAVAQRVLCDESETLANKVAASSGDGSCVMPYTAVCVHDSAALDPNCGSAASSRPPECDTLDPASEAWNPALPLSSPPLAYVEVRTCYRFTTLFNLADLRLPLNWGLSLGEIWLQRDRSFVAGDY